jgi:hypothetical protein
MIKHCKHVSNYYTIPHKDVCTINIMLINFWNEHELEEVKEKENKLVLGSSRFI